VSAASERDEGASAYLAIAGRLSGKDISYNNFQEPTKPELLPVK